MSNFYLSDSIEDLEQIFSDVRIEAANRQVLDKLQIALDVLGYAPDDAVSIEANAAGTQLTAEYSANPSADWSGNAKVVVDGSGLSTDPEDVDYTISAIRFTLTSSDAPNDWNQPLAEVDLGLQLTVAGDRAQSLAFSGYTIETGDISLSSSGSIDWQSSSSTVTLTDIRSTIVFDSDPGDTVVLTTVDFYMDGSLTFDLNAESISGTGKITEFGIRDEAGHHLYSEDLNISLIELIELAELDGYGGADLELIDSRLSDFWGYSDGVGDLNGDGWGDQLVSAGGQNSSGQWENYNYILFGGLNGWGDQAIDLAALDTGAGLRLDFSASTSLSSTSVSGVGDINGDGYADLSLSAYGKWESGSWSSKSFILFGKASGWQMPIDLSALTGSEGVELNFSGEQSTYLRAAGDLNGDGIGDLAVEAYGSNSSGIWESHNYFVFGKSSGWESEIDLATLNGIDGLRLNLSTDDYVHFGQAGDLNGDGIDDLLIDIYGASSQEYLLLGRTSGWEQLIGIEDMSSYESVLLPHYIFPDPDDILYTKGDVTLPEGIENVEVQGAIGLTVEGNSQDNRMVGGSGDDSFDGAAGHDTAVFSGSYADYTVTANSAGGGVTVSSTSDGTDSLVAVEVLQFSDQSIDLNTLFPAGEETTITAQFWKESAPLSGVNLELVDSSGMSSISTDINGGASTSVDLATTMAPSQSVSAGEEGSVNLQDAIMILKQIVGLEQFNEYQSVAADFDQNNDVGLNDAIGILKHVVGLPAPDPEWVFMESGATGPLANGALVMTPGDTRVELVGVLLGDVDGSYITQS